MTNDLESQILKLHSEGKKNRQIARELSIHHNTVGYWLKKHNIQSHGLGLPIDMVDAGNARCRRCLKIKSVHEFQFGRRNKKYQYRFSYCNLCRKNQNNLNLNSDVNRFLADRFNRMKRRAKEKNIPCTITKEEFIQQYHSQNGFCFYTDTKMVCEVGSDLHRDSLSVDKIIPEHGYIKGNVVFTTHRINTCKCDLLLEEISKWMPSWYYRIENFLLENKDE